MAAFDHVCEIATQKWHSSVIHFLFSQDKGLHDSFQEPPDFPVFGNVVKKHTKKPSELTQALTEMATIFKSDGTNNNTFASANQVMSL